MELIKNNVKYYFPQMIKTIVYEESTDAIVPDSYPDIMRIVHSEGVAEIKEENFQNDRVLVSGAIKASVVYMPENENTLKKLNIPINFAQIEESKDIGQESIGTVACKVISVDARAVNSRKISVTANIQMSYKAYGQKEAEICNDIKSDDYEIEILCDTRQVSLPVKIKNKPLSIVEDVEIKEGINDIVSNRCFIEDDEVKCMNGKAVIRGRANIQTLAINDSGEFESINNSIPFTHIIEDQRITEDDNASVNFCLRGIEGEKRSDNLMSFGISADSQIKVYEDYQIPIILDVYQTEYDMETQVDNISIVGEELNRGIRFSEKSDILTGMNISKILDVNTAYENEIKNNAVMVNANIIYLSDDGMPYSILRRVSLPMPTEEKFEIEDMFIDVSPSIIGNDTVSLKFNVKINGFTEQPILVANIVDAKICTDKAKLKPNDVSMVIKYTNDSESLWNIAKEYNTTRKSIIEANKLNDNVDLVERGILLIPIK